MNVADQILKALNAAGTKGLLLEELTTSLEIDAEIITTTIRQLMSEGQIMAKQELEKTRYLLSGQTTGEVEPTSLGDLNGCPCFHCLKISKCGARQPDSPISCSRLEEWLLSFDS